MRHLRPPAPSSWFGAYRAKKFPESKTWSYVFSHVTPTRPEETGTARDGEKLLAWPASDASFGWMDLDDEPTGHAGLEGKKDELLLEFLQQDPTLPRV